MNSSKYIILVCLFFVSSLVYGQTKQCITSGDFSNFNVNEDQVNAPSTATNFWRPFTIELNTNGTYHGISLEKQIKKKLFVRASFSSDFEFKSKYFDIDIFSPSESFLTYSPFGNKLSLGVLYNILNFDYINTSIRTGVQAGLRQKPEEAFYGSRVSNLFIELPVLIQFRIAENYSIDLGVRPLVERLVWPGASIANGFFYEFSDSSNHLEYHLGLRYTFAEKQ